MPSRFVAVVAHRVINHDTRGTHCSTELFSGQAEITEAIQKHIPEHLSACFDVEYEGASTNTGPHIKADLISMSGHFKAIESIMKGIPKGLTIVSPDCSSMVFMGIANTGRKLTSPMGNTGLPQNTEWLICISDRKRRCVYDHEQGTLG